MQGIRLRTRHLFAGRLLSAEDLVEQLRLQGDVYILRLALAQIDAVDRRLRVMCSTAAHLFADGQELR